MKLTFVNVGYGEAILLECPDLCVSTRPHEDHVSGLLRAEGAVQAQYL